MGATNLGGPLVHPLEKARPSGGMYDGSVFVTCNDGVGSPRSSSFRNGESIPLQGAPVRKVGAGWGPLQIA